MTDENAAEFPFPTTASMQAGASASPVQTTPAGSVIAAAPATEEAIDEGVAESFPASDPVSVSVTRVVMVVDDGRRPLPGASDQPARRMSSTEPSAATLPLNQGDEAAAGRRAPGRESAQSAAAQASCATGPARAAEALG